MNWVWPQITQFTQQKINVTNKRNKYMPLLCLTSTMSLSQLWHCKLFVIFWSIQTDNYTYDQSGGLHNWCTYTYAHQYIAHTKHIQSHRALIFNQHLLVPWYLNALWWRKYPFGWESAPKQTRLWSDWDNWAAKLIIFLDFVLLRWTKAPRRHCYDTVCVL